MKKQKKLDKDLDIFIDKLFVKNLFRNNEKVNILNMLDKTSKNNSFFIIKLLYIL